MRVDPVVLKRSTKPFSLETVEGVCWIPEGVTGKVVLKVIPVTKAASAVAVTPAAAVWPAPRKVRKSRLKLGSYLARKLLVPVSAAGVALHRSTFKLLGPPFLHRPALRRDRSSPR